MSEAVLSTSQDGDPLVDVDTITEHNSLIAVDNCSCPCHSTHQPPPSPPPSTFYALLRSTLTLLGLLVVMTASWWVGAHPSSVTISLPSFTSVWEALSSPAPPPPPPAWDPLAACTAISPNLTASMLHYINTIQRPHVTADCSGYPDSGQCLTTPTPTTNATQLFTPSWLIFQVDAGNGWSGGFADRFKGLYTAFGLALVLRRAFAIELRDSVALTEYLDKGAVPWVTKGGIQREVANNEGKRGDKVKEFNYLMKGQFVNRTEGGQKRDWVKEWADLRVVSFHYNMNAWASLRENVLMTPAYTAMFGVESARVDMDFYWGCLQAALFRYSGAVEKVMDPILTEMKRPRVNDVVVGTKVKGLQIHSLSINRTVEVAPLAPPRRLYCAQLRMGSAAKTGDVAGADTQSFLTLTQIEEVFRHMADKFSRDRQQHNVSAEDLSDLFITSDSEDYAVFVPKYFPASMYRKVDVPGLQAHVDILARDGSRSFEEKLSTHVRVVGSHYLLGECDLVLISQSGFGATAMWRTRNRGMEEPMREVGYEGKVWQVVLMDGAIRPYTHRVGSNGREDVSEGGDPAPGEV